MTKFHSNIHGSVKLGVSALSLVSSLLCVGPVGAATTAIRIDHTTLDLSAMTSARRSAARALRLSFEHASVGALVWTALDQLQQADSTLAHPNWVDLNRGNPGWQAKLDQFLTDTSAPASSSYSVISMKFCYIDDGADANTYMARLDAIEAAHRNQTLIWWTMPIMTTGSAARDAFNTAVRLHTAQNGRVLIDIADIESHDANGKVCTNGGYSSLCTVWNSDGGHPNSAGARRIAQALWRAADAIALRGPA